MQNGTQVKLKASRKHKKQIYKCFFQKDLSLTLLVLNTPAKYSRFHTIFWRFMRIPASSLYYFSVLSGLLLLGFELSELRFLRSDWLFSHIFRNAETKAAFKKQAKELIADQALCEFAFDEFP